MDEAPRGASSHHRDMPGLLETATHEALQAWRDAEAEMASLCPRSPDLEQTIARLNEAKRRYRAAVADAESRHQDSGPQTSCGGSTTAVQ